MKKISFASIFLLVFSAFGAGYSYGAIFEVKNTLELHEALSIAAHNGESDLIKVYQGFYGGRFVYYSGEEHMIQIFGGYTSEGDRSNDPSKTILDGQYQGCTLYCVGCGHIMIEGLTIQHGRSDGTLPGGLLASSVSWENQAGNVLLINNIIKDNSTVDDGGGVHAESWAPKGTSGGVMLAGNTITGNTARYGGGAFIYVLSGVGEKTGRITLSANIISDNYSDDDGGGVKIWSRADSGQAGEVSVYKNTILGNNANSDGGGVCIDSDSTSGFAEGIYVKYNTVSENSATSYGGGVCARSESSSGTAAAIIFEGNTFLENIAEGGGGAYGRSYPAFIPGDVTFIGNTVSKNSASQVAGGIQAGSDASVILVNNMITDNQSDIFYGGTLASGNVTLTNNTISGNQANDLAGGAGIAAGIFASVYNNIIWGNSAPEGGDIVLIGCALYSGFNNDYSNMLGAWSSEANNIDQNPIFVGGDDYHLYASSPCKDAGTDGAPGLPSTDFDGQNRIIGDAPDIGADEIGAWALLRYLAQVIVYCELPSGPTTSMLSKIENAQKSYKKRNFTAAINQVRSLINYVEAQRGKKLSIRQADEIIALSNETIVALEDERYYQYPIDSMFIN